jgi:hypothetical protein
MSVNVAQFPASKWDTSSPERTSDRQRDQSPSYEDWDQLVAEVLALQDMFLVEAVNGEGGDITKGYACYMKSDGEWALADADAAGERFAMGLAVALVADGLATKVQVAGVMTMTAAEWDAVAGTSGGLDEGVDYYLQDATPGKITQQHLRPVQIP